MKFNFKTDKLPFENFNFGGRSYCKIIDDIKPNQKNGYGLIGDFVPKKEQTNLKNGKLYLSVSRGGKKEITHLFTIKNDKPVLIATSNKQKGAIKDLWDEIEQFIANRPKKSVKQLIDMVLAEVNLSDNDMLYQVAQGIVNKAKEKDDIHTKMNDWTFQSGIRGLRLEKGCYPMQINPYNEIRKGTELGKEFEAYYEKGVVKQGGFVEKWKIYDIHRF